MKISGIMNHNIYKNYNNDNNLSDNNKNNVGVKNISNDRIEISDEARKLNSYDRLENVDNSKKIEEIKNKIKNGTYEINAKGIAKKMAESIIRNGR